MLVYKDIVDFEKKVLTFNAVMGNFPDNKELISTYTKLCIEEGRELLTAKDHEDILDAIIDQVFTGFMLNSLTCHSFEGSRKFVELALASEPYCYINAETMLALLSEGNENYIAYTTEIIHMLAYYQDTYDIVGAFNHIFECNMSKFCIKGQVDIEAELEYIRKQGRYGKVFFEEVCYEGNTYIVFRALEDLQEGNTFSGRGKLVKHRNVQNPKLSQFI